MCHFATVKHVIGHHSCTNIVCDKVDKFTHYQTEFGCTQTHAQHTHKTQRSFLVETWPNIDPAAMLQGYENVTNEATTCLTQKLITVLNPSTPRSDQP